MATLGLGQFPEYRRVTPLASRDQGLDHYLHEPIFKRPFDLLLSAIGLFLSFPFWIVVGVLIWLEDGRPVFFPQYRLGRNGKLFWALKFRSMVKNRGKVEVQARKDDPRVTRVGKFLRKTALDELPQIWNIFRGDMSFVGPRAQPEKEIVRVRDKEQELYIRDVPGYALRQLVRPGLTGVAQIYAPRDVPHRQKFRYDSVYVKKIMGLSQRGIVGDLLMFWLDLRLIFISVWNTVTAHWEV